MESMSAVLLDGNEIIIGVDKDNGNFWINVTSSDIPVLMKDGTEAVLVKSGVVVNVMSSKIEIEERYGVKLMKTVFLDNPVLEAIEEEYPEAFIIGSTDSAKAYLGRVKEMIVAPGFESEPPNKRKMRIDRVNSY